MLCRACFLSAVESLQAILSLLCGEFHQAADRDVIRTDRTCFHGSEEIQTAVCVCKDVCMRDNLWACHLWICSSKLIIGWASSSLWTENLKPTDSWARAQRKREDIKTTCDGRKETKDKTRHICASKDASSLNRPVVKSMLTMFSKAELQRQMIRHVC